MDIKQFGKIAGKTKWDRVCNKDTRKITKQEPIMTKMKKK